MNVLCHVCLHLRLGAQSMTGSEACEDGTPEERVQEQPLKHGQSPAACTRHRLGMYADSQGAGAPGLFHRGGDLLQ